MTGRSGTLVQEGGVTIECLVDGNGPPFVILPSYGRSGADFDDIAARLVAAGWTVLRPQPRGVAGSTGPMTGVVLPDLADDVARCLRRLANGPAILLGHAFGNVLARAVATLHPALVKAVVLAAAQASKVTGPSAGPRSSPGTCPCRRPTGSRRCARRSSPGHDPGIWLDGWHPDTLRMQHEAVTASGLEAFQACGDVPLLQIIAEHDPFIPEPYWDELHMELGDRVDRVVIEDASHALFVEQPDAVAEAVLSWAARHRG